MQHSSNISRSIVTPDSGKILPIGLKTKKIDTLHQDQKPEDNLSIVDREPEKSLM